MNRAQYTQRDIELETRLTSLETKINEIATNHLVHLDAKMDRIQWLVITTLITVVVALAMKFVQ